MRDMTAGEVRARAEVARSFFEVAQLIAEEEPESYASVAGSLCVLAGIAASDAICGHVLGKRPRGQDHGQAAEVLGTIRGAGDSTRALKRLLEEKDTAQYGTSYLSRDKVRQMLRRVTVMLDGMDAVLSR
ncbi:hypothetical protein [Quadrisphaera setariae]|uniref:HEPN domain-containing protein n=1 Tax=Quadrisphaera setariae TaxID=2593304 RepID=A0A5C8ZE23_9ACTN|nr:hypothetical protein [Quadrisphaera setariae]TXR56305.1 hypothetical protein FMM08_09300 [Quadrisphaera setariae]